MSRGNMCNVVGVDVGGTNTDAIMLEDNKIIGWAKSPTTDNVTDGIVQSIKQLLDTLPDKHHSNVHSITIGTTHLLNALLQEKALDKVLVLRLAAPATTAALPGIGWKKKLRESIIGDAAFIVKGGYEYDGREISALDQAEIDECARYAQDRGIFSVAVTGVFSHVRNDQELRVKEILEKINPRFQVSLSHELGDLGLLTRENATIINASLSSVFYKLRQAIMQVMPALGFHAKLYLSNSTGTTQPLVDIDHNITKPILTLNSGPTNSVRGAGIIAGVSSAIVVDIGGTSLDVGVLEDDFPIMENTPFHITEASQISCHFPRPRIQSVALGGGSIITVKSDTGELILGPESVANHLETESLIFGGNIFTLTDVAYMLGRLKCESKLSIECLKVKLQQVHHGDIDNLLQSIDEQMHQRLVDSILKVIVSMEHVSKSVVLVGGGAVLFDTSKVQKILKQQYMVIMPEHANIANAVGASIAQTSVQVSKLYNYRETSRANAIAITLFQAVRQLLEQNVLLDTIKIAGTGFRETRLNYLSGDPVQLVITLVVDLNYLEKKHYELADIYKHISRIMQHVGIKISEETIARLVHSQDKEIIAEKTQKQTAAPHSLQELYDIKLPKTLIEHRLKTNVLSKETINDIAVGAGFLGSGGGGNPELGRLIALSLLENKKTIQWIRLQDLPDEANVIAFGVMGSPVVLSERLPAIDEGVKTIRHIESITKKKIDAIMIMESGGTNATYPFLLAAMLGIPVVDACCMGGRAFPGINMVLANISGEFKQHIAVIANASGSQFMSANNFSDMESIARVATIEMGGIVSLAYLPMTGAQAKRWSMPRALMIAANIGRVIRTNQGGSESKIDALYKVLSKTEYDGIDEVVRGRIINIMREEIDGFSVGGVLLESLGKGGEVKHHEVGFRNENLFVREYASKNIIVCVPDLIIFVDINTFNAVSCEDLQYGLNLILLTMSASKKLKTESAKKIVGRSAFQFDKIDLLFQKMRGLGEDSEVCHIHERISGAI